MFLDLKHFCCLTFKIKWKDILETSHFKLKHFFLNIKKQKTNFETKCLGSPPFWIFSLTKTIFGKIDSNSWNGSVLLNLHFSQKMFFEKLCPPLDGIQWMEYFAMSNQIYMYGGNKRWHWQLQTFYWLKMKQFFFTVWHRKGW